MQCVKYMIIRNNVIISYMLLIHVQLWTVRTAVTKNVD